MVPISRLPILTAPRGSRPNEVLVPKTIMYIYQGMLILQLMLRKIIRIVIPISRLLVLAALKGSRPNAGTCTENYNVTNDDQEDDHLSCL